MPIADLIYGWCELDKALPRYLKAESFAEGQVDEVFADPKVRRELAVTGEEYKFNLIKTAITVRADRCEVSALKVPANEAATKRITEVWDANDMATYYPTLIRDSFMYGDAYLMVWPVPTDDITDESDDALVAAKVELTTKNPKNTRVIYDEQNERKKRFAIQRWPMPGKDDDRWRVELFYADRVERFVSLKGQALDQEAGWAQYDEPDEDQQAVEAHDFGEVPFFHHRTAVPYGTPVHKAGYGSQLALNKMLITQITTTDSHGFPQRYGLLNKDATLDQQNDDPQWQDDATAGVYLPDPLNPPLGGQGSGVRSGPGTMQTWAGMDSVGQFSAADPAVFTDPAELYIRLMAQTTTTPLHYFDPSGDAPSGESLKVAEAPLIKAIEWLQLLQGSAIEEEWLFVLRVLAVRADTVEVRWASVASATGLADWQMVRAKIDVGVPVDQALVETGYEPEQVATGLAAEAAANTLASRVALLGQIGTAVQSIGAGVALGVIDQAAAAQAIATVLGQVNASGQGVEPA